MGETEMAELTEQMVRVLRDIVFEQHSSDKNWTACRDHWMRPDSVSWLQEQAAKRRWTA